MDQNTLNHPSFLPTQDQVKDLVSDSDLGLSWLIQGETALLRRDLSKGLECFNFALQFAPNDPSLYFSQGLALFEFGNQTGQHKALLAASKKFKTATLLDPSYFEGWLTWGSLFCTLGLTTKQLHYFQSAKEKLDRAIQLAENQSDESLLELYWDLGVVMSQLAKHSEEVCDWHEAVEAFEKAQGYGKHLPAAFWQDFATACLQFSKQRREAPCYFKAISCVKKALALEPGNAQHWRLLANIYCFLYSLTEKEGYFSEASRCFDLATQKDPQNVELLIEWITFLLSNSKHELKTLRLCIAQSEWASSLERRNPKILALWAEALSYLGVQTQEVELLNDALDKITEAVERDEGDPNIWYSFGKCMQCFGHYFDSHDDYYQAIEKFQAGLSVDRSSYRNWHAIASVYALLGESENHPENFVLALRFFQKALHLQFCNDTLFQYAKTLTRLGEVTLQQHVIEEAVTQFEQLFSLQNPGTYPQTEWLFEYASALDLLGDFDEEESYYIRAVEVFSHVLIIDPDYKGVHHKLGLLFSRLGDLLEHTGYFYRSLYHYGLASRNDEENDILLVDWAVALIRLATYLTDATEKEQRFHEAEEKIYTAMRLGNMQSWYYLACLYSLKLQYGRAMQWLNKAKSCRALPPLDEMQNEEWLDPLRSTEEFQNFIIEISSTSKFQRES